MSNLKPTNPGTSLKELRMRLDITVREVEIRSQEIAEAQGNPEFFISNTWLTRLENTNAIPSVHKLFSLCAIYRVRLADMLPMFGIDLDLLQKYEILIPPANTQILALENTDPQRRVTFPVRFDAGFRPEETNLLSRMVQVWGEVPVSLIQSFDVQHSLYGYIGLEDFTMFPLLRPGSFVFIDDKRREIASGQWSNEWERPIYFLELRSGYACGWCERRGDDLLLVPHPLSSQPHRIFPANEAEVIGQVTAMAVRLAGLVASDPAKTPAQLPKRQQGST